MVMRLTVSGVGRRGVVEDMNGGAGKAGLVVVRPRGVSSLQNKRRICGSRIGSGFAFSGDLSTYSGALLPSFMDGNGAGSRREHMRPAPWFQGAIEEIVRQLQSAPFVQIVKLGNNPSQAEDLSTYKLSTNNGEDERSHVSSQMWDSIAQSLRCDGADAVILVQKIVDNIDLQSLADTEVEQQPSDVSVHDACQKLISSGVGQSILRGQVGECCDSATARTDESNKNNGVSGEINEAMKQRVGLPAVGTISRPVVKVAALPKGGKGRSVQPSSFHGYWGVVVQSKCRTGVEGCYLLKAGRAVADGGCSCTHFSLTRVSAHSGPVHSQFVNSWNV